VWLEPPLPLENELGLLQARASFLSSLTVKLTVVLPATSVAAPACGRVTPRAEQQPEDREDQNNYTEPTTAQQNNNAEPTMSGTNSYEKAAAAMVQTYELTRVLKAARREKYELAAAAHRDAQRRFIMEMAEKSQSDFDNTFTWEERKVMAARAYWARSVAEMEQNQTPVGAVGEQAELAGEAAGGVSRPTVQRWMYDFQSNGGLFSESLWG
jgi:hypothetical protein